MPARFDRFRQQFLQSFEDAAQVEQALRSARNHSPFFFFHRSTDPDLKSCWLVLGRLGPEMERTLSISGEVLFMFSPYEDFQRRSFNKLASRARDEVLEVQRDASGDVRFTPDPHVALLWSADPSLERNLKAWNAEGAKSLVAPIPLDASNPQAFLDSLTHSIASVLASRDLYAGKNPVTGNDFFGRLPTMQKIAAELRAGRSVGLFGLRRSGKTSFIRELQRREEARGVALVLSDLESVETVDDLPLQISQDLLNTLRRIKSAGGDVWIGSESEHEVTTFSNLSSRLIKAAERNPDLHFVLAVDEIENLRRLAKDQPEKVRLFLGAIRRAAQATTNLSLFFTGVTTHYFTSSMIDEGVDNPLFGFIDSHYLEPFTRAESAELLSDLGNAMMLRWDSEALDLVHSIAGGFPFFVRDLASMVRNRLLQQASADTAVHIHLDVLPADVTSALADWSVEAALSWVEICKTLRSYHELMAEMVEGESDQVDDWRVMGGAEGDTAVRALEKLGVLVREGDGYQHSPSLRALRALTQGRAPEPDAADLHKSVSALLKQPESGSLEFKSSARWNQRSGKKDSAIEDAIVKTVAGFLNADGGTLLIGVADDGTPCGLEEDIKLCRDSVDQYERWLVGDLLCDRISSATVPSHVSFSSTTINSHLVVRLSVTASNEVAWVRDGEDDRLYVRNGNETRMLRGRDAVTYALSRGGRSEA